MKRKIIYLLIIAVSTYFAWIFIKSETSQPTIGGNFNLVNQFEEQVSLDDFKDNYLLIYFGYTFCPDVCPLSVNEMLLTKRLLRKEGKKITPIFITVDPERDNVENITGVKVLNRQNSVGYFGDNVGYPNTSVTIIGSETGIIETMSVIGYLGQKGSVFGSRATTKGKMNSLAMEVSLKNPTPEERPLISVLSLKTVSP